MKRTALLLFICWIATIPLHAKDPGSTLKKNLELTIAPFKGIVGIAVNELETGETVLINNMHHYPMQSTYKFPLAIYILDMVDRGNLKTDQVVHVKKQQMHRNTWSPLWDKYPDTDFDITVGELLDYSVSKSDNNACDLLFKLAGGTRFVHQYFRNARITGIAITATEAEMHGPWQIQYNNWCQPSAMLELLKRFYEGKFLSKNSNEFLMKLMTESENSAKRIKGQLPEGTIVSHKTGTSGANDRGMIAATNDIGIVTLPNGHHVAIVVFASDYKGSYTDGEKIIAEVAKCAWDYYTSKK